MKRHIHFIGIGGIGVSGVAQLALRKGEVVSGSDLKESATTQKLAKMGAQIFIGHEALNITAADLVVYSSAITDTNPEITAAKVRGIPVLRRAEFLSELMADKQVITITGAHGKTTTSSLVAKLLTTAGFHPTIAVGGVLREDGDNAKLGDSPYFVAEADESDGTFLLFKPMYSIITNIDDEHMDFYKTEDNLLKSFSTFVEQTKKDGCVFYFKEDTALASLVEKSGVKSRSFGLSKRSDFYAKDISLAQCRLRFLCVRQAEQLGEISMELSGRHNVLNALAVVALGFEMGIDFKVIQKALKDFKGVERRFQIKHENNEVLIIDDYAHHPTEIAATIEAAKACPRRRLIVVFQPHRYSRTKLLLDRFPASFAKSDYLVVTDIYPAGEAPVVGASVENLIEGIRKKTRVPVDYVPKNQIISHLKNTLQPNDLVLFLGAGDITKISDEFAKGFKK